MPASKYYVAETYPAPHTVEEICVVGQFDDYQEAASFKSIENLGRDYSTVAVCTKIEDELWALHADRSPWKPIVQQAGNLEELEDLKQFVSDDLLNEPAIAAVLQSPK